MAEQTLDPQRPTEPLPAGVRQVVTVSYSSELAEQVLFKTPSEASEFGSFILRMLEVDAILKDGPSAKGQTVSHGTDAVSQFRRGLESILAEFDRPGFHILAVLKVDPLGAAALLSDGDPRGRYARELCVRLARLDSQGNEWYTSAEVPEHLRSRKGARGRKKGGQGS